MKVFWQEFQCLDHSQQILARVDGTYVQNVRLAVYVFGKTCGAYALVISVKQAVYRLIYNFNPARIHIIETYYILFR